MSARIFSKSTQSRAAPVGPRRRGGCLSLAAAPLEARCRYIVVRGTFQSSQTRAVP